MSLIGLARTHAKVAGRQKALWFTTIPLTAFATLLAVISPAAPGTGGVEDLAFTGQMIVIFTGIAYAAGFTDFFTAPARLGIHELEASAPVAPLTLRAARLLGAFAVVVAPSLLVLLLRGIQQTADGNFWSLPAAIGVVATIVSPAALIAMALSGLTGAILPRAPGRIIAVVMWFWLWAYTPLVPIPTLNGTILGVIGDTVGAGYFGLTPFYPPSGPLGLEGTPLTATVSLLWQLILILALLAAGSALAERARKR